MIEEYEGPKGWRFWKDPKRKKTFRELIKRKSLFEIAAEEKMRLSTLKRMLANPNMLEAIDDWLSLKTFDYEIKKRQLKIQAMEALEKKFQSSLDQASADRILKTYVELLTEKDKEPKALLEHLVKIVENSFKHFPGRKPKPENVKKKLEEEFGYESLELPANENSGVDKTERDKDEQEAINRI